MGEHNLNIFNDDGNEITLPSSQELDESVISKGIDKAIEGETVKSLIIPEEMAVFPRNFVLDLTDVKEMGM